MPNRPGFQTFVNNELPIAVAGDFASANPRTSVVGGPGQYVAPAAGTNVGMFAWFDPTTGLATNYYKPGAFLGFVHRENNGLITQFLGISTVQVVPGNMVTGLSMGDFYGLFAGGATVGQKVYANPTTGALTAAVTGGTVTGSYTGTTVTSNVMTTTDANLTGTAAAVGQLVSGGTLPEGTYIASSGGTGSGTHLWNLANVNGAAIPNQTAFASSEYGIQETNFVVASSVPVDSTFTGAIAVTGILTVSGGVTGGPVVAGQFVTDTAGNIPANANAQILSQITGTAGGNGTYQLSYAPLVAITAEAMTAAAGHIAAITSWQLKATAA